jgi:hypothetical protein
MRLAKERDRDTNRVAVCDALGDVADDAYGRGTDHRWTHVSHPAPP